MTCWHLFSTFLCSRLTISKGCESTLHPRNMTLYMIGSNVHGSGTSGFPFDGLENSTGWVRVSLLSAQNVDAHEDVLK